jgi:precorrin isomerase
MFHTCFQQDFYETIILTRKKQVSEAQWVDQSQMEQQNDPFFNQIVLACANHHAKELMRFKFDWNKEIIAQFFATMYVDEAGNIRKMH